MNKEKLEKELSVFSEDSLEELLDIYQMMDWGGCNWEEFLNFFSSVIQKEIEKWKKEDVDEEE